MIRCLVLILMMVLTACADPRDSADALARRGGMAARDIVTRPFHLRAYVRGAGAPVLRVYLEGDGHAWRTRNQPSDDPTPHLPVSLLLALRDPAPTVAYLGRPCQYVVADPACTTSVWTGGRYSETVIASLDQAVSQLRAAAGADKVELVGFSGGGAVAALLAARRADVVSLRTVAANLDTDAWTAQQGISPLRDSLNPASVAPQLKDLPQVHFAGGDDTVVDPSITRAFAHSVGSQHCIRIEVVAGLRHDGEWAGLWADLLRIQPVCR
jgi:pimeloyl-ACP methyl ester carboxylesterase